ncbi:MAG TPA: geranylgeranyl reductase family protein [Thermosynechococcaceae cyanobacterium]
MIDCIVIGAGPAGASAAYHLAKRGRSVLILEQAKLPRYKCCTGAVSPAIAQWFDFDLSPAIALKVDNIRYTWKLDDPVDVKVMTPEPIWMVERTTFDQFLVQQAQHQGAELRDGTEATGIDFKRDHWQVHTADGLLTARYLIAADGATGSTRQRLGFKPAKQRMGATLEIKSSTVNQSYAQFEFGMVKNGTIWSFPKSEGYALGVASFRGSEPRELDRSLTDLKSQLGISADTSQVFFHPLNLWDGNQKLHTRNALLVGDAACVCDPLIPEGIRPSILTGVKAAEAIDQALAGNVEALAGYSQIIQEEWGADMIWAQRLAALFYRVPGLAYQMGIKRPSATDRISKILCGQMRYGDIAAYALKKLSSGLLPGMK